MGKETRLFKSEERQNRTDVATFLRELAGKVGVGRVVLRQGEEEIGLDLPNNLILETQVEQEDKGQKGIQYSLEIEIKWFEGNDRGGPLELG
jgi:amphi-Trp domain-containing protein